MPRSEWTVVDRTKPLPPGVRNAWQLAVGERAAPANGYMGKVTGVGPHGLATVKLFPMSKAARKRMQQYDYRISQLSVASEEGGKMTPERWTRLLYGG